MGPVTEADLHSYFDGCGLGDDPKGVLFRTVGRGTGRALSQSDAHAMIDRRTVKAGIDTRIGNHSFGATGITAYLKNGGQLETAAAMANHTPAA